MASDIWTGRELAWRLLIRDIKSRYRQSLLGLAWGFLPPLATAAVFYILNRQGVINVADTGIPYPAFVLIGTLLWQTFVEGLNGPLRAVAQGRTLITKVNFPREALAMAAAGQVLFETTIRIIVLIIVLAAFRIAPDWATFAAPFALLLILFLGVALGLLLVPIGGLYTDVSLGLSSVTSLWFFITPVVYPLPETGTFSTLLKINPVTPLLVGTRDLIVNGTLTDPIPFAIVAVITVVVIFLAWVIFRLTMPIITERLGS